MNRLPKGKIYYFIASVLRRHGILGILGRLLLLLLHSLLGLLSFQSLLSLLLLNCRLLGRRQLLGCLSRRRCASCQYRLYIINTLCGNGCLNSCLLYTSDAADD